jgi:hypothetical protein
MNSRATIHSFQQAAEAGFIEFACEVLNIPSYQESLEQLHTFTNTKQFTLNEDFDNYQVCCHVDQINQTI